MGKLATFIIPRNYELKNICERMCVVISVYCEKTSLILDVDDSRQFLHSV